MHARYRAKKIEQERTRRAKETPEERERRLAYHREWSQTAIARVAISRDTVEKLVGILLFTQGGLQQLNDWFQVELLCEVSSGDVAGVAPSSRPIHPAQRLGKHAPHLQHPSVSVRGKHL